MPDDVRPMRFCASCGAEFTWQHFDSEDACIRHLRDRIDALAEALVRLVPAEKALRPRPEVKP